jgi:hypothetical protein
VVNYPLQVIIMDALRRQPLVFRPTVTTGAIALSLDFILKELGKFFLLLCLEQTKINENLLVNHPMMFVDNQLS